MFLRGKINRFELFFWLDFPVVVVVSFPYLYVSLWWGGRGKSGVKVIQES